MGVASGATSCLFWPMLPGLWWLLPLLCLSIPLLYMRRLGLAGLLLGASAMLLFFNLQLSWLAILPSKASEHTIAGQVVEFEQSEYGPRILFRLRQLDEQHLWPAPLLRLYLSPSLSLTRWFAGQEIQGRARLKPLHAVANPAGFDRERWMLGQGITATGTVQLAQLSSPHEGPHWRDRWVATAEPLLAKLEQGAVLNALVFGEQHAISSATWQAFRYGGIVHLVAISGMHIALAAALGWGLGRLLAIPLSATVLSRWLPPACALGLSGFYVLLSGASLPTQRAFYMLCLWLGLRLLACRWSHWRIWWSTLALMLLGSGWSLFNSGFWLSFLAVALLLMLSLWWRRPGLWRLQLGMLYGLLPLQIALFDGQGLLALPINLLAIPFFTLLLIPLSFFSALWVPVWPTLAYAGFWLCDQLLSPAISGLVWLTSRFDGWFVLSARQQQHLWLGWALPIVWFFPGGRSLVCCLLFAQLCLFIQPAPGWQLHVLDVGQGLSVLIQQGTRGIVYDVGDRFPGGQSLAESVVSPMLQYQGIRQLDYLIISHDDRDHAGKWRWLEQQWPVHHLVSSAALHRAQRTCLAGVKERWGELTLSWLWPLTVVTGKENAHSCVLLITDGRFSVLLTGDLPARQESELIRRGQSPVTVLLSAHHGSASSSSWAWVQATRPQWVVHSAGYANRWGFPRAEVVARFSSVSSSQMTTADTGAISFTFGDESVAVTAWREQGPWYHRIEAWLGRD